MPPDELPMPMLTADRSPPCLPCHSHKTRRSAPITSSCTTLTASPAPPSPSASSPWYAAECRRVPRRVPPCTDALPSRQIRLTRSNPPRPRASLPPRGCSSHRPHRRFGSTYSRTASGASLRATASVTLAATASNGALLSPSSASATSRAVCSSSRSPPTPSPSSSHGRPTSAPSPPSASPT